jgi:hypothetical protein
MKTSKMMWFAVALFAIVGVLLFASMPFGSFRLPVAIAAQYDAPNPADSVEAKGCGGIVTSMVVLRDGGVPVYGDRELKNRAAVTNGVSKKYFLRGPDTRSQGYQAIFFAGDNRLFVSASDVIDVTPRS